MLERRGEERRGRENMGHGESTDAKVTQSHHNGQSTRHIIFDAPYNRDVDDGDGDGKTKPKPRVRMCKWSDWRSALTASLMGQRDMQNRIGETPSPLLSLTSCGTGLRRSGVTKGFCAGMRSGDKSVLSLAALASSTSLANLADANTSISSSLGSSDSVHCSDGDEKIEISMGDGERCAGVFKRGATKKLQENLSNVERFLKYGAEMEEE